MTSTEEKLKTATFRYIEQEIYSYHETLKRIELLKYQIMCQSTNNDDENTQAGRNSVRNNHSETEEKATSLLTDKRITKLEEKAEAVKKAYDHLVDEKKAVIDLYYWERPGELTWDGVASETNTSRATALRWRKQFVLNVAKELGEI